MWDLFCEDGAVHFLSQPVEHPTDYLELSVHLPDQPNEIRLIHFNDLDGLISHPNTIAEEKSGDFNLATGEIRYVIERPQLNHKYMITWKLSDSQYVQLATRTSIKRVNEIAPDLQKGTDSFEDSNSPNTQ